MARGDINEYYDPRHERQMAEMLKRSQAMNQGTHLGGLASLLTQLHRGFRMQKDRKQRADTTEAVADAMSKSYKAPVEGSVEELVSNIDNASIMADPDEYPKLAEKLKNLSGTGAVSTESEMIDKDALKQQMGVKDIFPQLAEQIDPNQLGGRTQLDNAFVGRDTVAAQEGYDPYRRALSNLRALGGDNPYAARMAANMGMQQAGTARAARIAADIRDEDREYKANLLADKIRREDIVRQEEFTNQQIIAELKEKGPPAWQEYVKAQTSAGGNFRGTFTEWVQLKGLARTGILLHPKGMASAQTGRPAGAPTPLSSSLANQGTPQSAARVATVPTSTTPDVTIVPKSPADIAAKNFAASQKKTERKLAKGEANIVRAAGTVVADAGRALKLAQDNYLATGIANDVFGWMNMDIIAEALGDAKAMRDLTTSIKGNISVDQIMAMKAASETGGALGHVPQQQMKTMMGLLGAIDPNQRRDIFIDNIKRVQNLYQDLIHGTKEQIQQLLIAGEITPKIAAQNSKRQILSFDKFGNSLNLIAPEGVEEADIKYTMRKRRMTREEVIKEIRLMRGAR